jgi:flagellar assembly protein FliH
MSARDNAMSGDVARWDMPSVSGKPIQARRGGPTVADLEKIEQRAYQEAFAAGREAAKAEAQQQLDMLRKQVAQLDAIGSMLSQPLRQLDQEVEQQLVMLALTVAKQLIRRELRIDPAQVIAVIRESVSQLPAAARNARVHLHPEDAAIVRERLATPAAECAWSIVEDPVMTRGGCRITTDTAQIDARLESRMAAVIATVMGEERGGSRVEEGK